MELDYGKYLTVLAIGLVALLLGTWVETANRPAKVKKRRENNPPLGDYKSIKEWE